MTAEEYTKAQTVSVSFTPNGMHVLEKHVYELMESYHKESSKELVEALSSFVKAVKNEDIIIHDNIDSDGFGSTVNFLYRQAEEAVLWVLYLGYGL